MADHKVNFLTPLLNFGSQHTRKVDPKNIAAVSQVPGVHSAKSSQNLFAKATEGINTNIGVGQKMHLPNQLKQYGGSGTTYAIA